MLEPLLRFSRTSRLQRFIAPVLALVVCALLLVIFQHLSRAVNYKTVVHELHGMTFDAWAGALVATALSYAALVGRDAVGLRYLDAKVPRPVLWVGATVASALGNATGFGALTGGAVRCRVYGVAGVTPAQVGRLTVFTSVTLALALLLMTAIGMVCAADTLAGMLHLSPDHPAMQRRRDPGWFRRDDRAVRRVAPNAPVALEMAGCHHSRPP